MSQKSKEGVKQCPYNGCDWSGRPYDTKDEMEEIAAQVDAEYHWETVHGGNIPDEAEFGDAQCPKCDDTMGFNGTVSCSSCGWVPKEVRA